MSTVVAFDFSQDPARPPETPAQRRVRIGSRWTARLFTGLFALAAAVLATAIVVMLFYKGEMVRIGPDNCYLFGGPPNSVAFGSLPLDQRLAYVVVAVLRATPILMLFWTTRALFRQFAIGRTFSGSAARRFRDIGVWLCAYALSPFICHVLLSTTGYEIDKNWAHLASLQAFILGLLVLVVGQVMQVGSEIEEDREAFV